MKKTFIYLLFLSFGVSLCGCTLNGSVTTKRTISRHYVLSNGHASLNSDDFGETEYITNIDGGIIKKTNYCNFDSFYYYENEESTVKSYHKGFSDYINIDQDKSFFNFHYDGHCEYRISLLDNTFYENSGDYKFVSEDNIDISFANGAKSYAITRFGLSHKGIGEGKITFLQTPIDVRINDELITIYFWFYDGILHPSPWGEN